MKWWRRLRSDEPINWWWHALNPIDADLLEGEKKTLRLRIALTIQLEELKDQLSRLEATIDPEGRSDVQ